MIERSGEEQAETPVERLSDGGAATGPSGPAYATLAEGHRRAGRAHEAETLARAGLRIFPGGTSGRLALALALLDQRRIEEARREVEGLLESLAEFQAARGALAALIGESDPVESDTDEETVDAAMDAWADDEAEPMAEEDENVLAEGSSPFATATMAGLLERQGHAEDARALRARLETPGSLRSPPPAASAADEEAFLLPEPEPHPEPLSPAPLLTVPEPSSARAAASERLSGDADLAGFARDDVAPAAAPPAALDAKAQRRAQVISTLERWLDNLRRGVA